MTGRPRLDSRELKKAVYTSPIGSDFAMIDKVTSIDQTGCSCLIYACKYLHARLQGSIDCMDITNNGIIYEFVGITNTTLSLTTTGPSNVAKDGDVIVAFDNAAFFYISTRPYVYVVTIISPSLKKVSYAHSS